MWALFAAASLANGARPDVAANRADGLLELFHERFVQAPEGSDNWDRRKPDAPEPPRVTNIGGGDWIDLGAISAALIGRRMMHITRDTDADYGFSMTLDNGAAFSFWFNDNEGGMELRPADASDEPLLDLG